MWASIFLGIAQPASLSESFCPPFCVFIHLVALWGRPPCSPRPNYAMGPCFIALPHTAVRSYFLGNLQYSRRWTGWNKNCSVPLIPSIGIGIRIDI